VNYVNNVMKVIGNILKAVIALAMIVAVVAIGVFLFNIDIKFGSSSASSAGQPVPFTVQPGETVDTISQHLQQEGIVGNAFLFKVQLKLKGGEKDLKAGEFPLRTGMSTDELIKTLTTSPTDLELSFTIIEGWRLGQIADKLSADGIVDRDKFMQMAGTPEGAAAYQDDFLQASGRPTDQDLEGYLFPDTYKIKQSAGDNSDTIIKKMLGTMEDKFTPDIRKTIADRQLNVHQVLTVASIVQREGQKKQELPTIAAVFWNRLDQGMRLDADPTTQYALGKPGDWWPQLNLAPAEVINPYNTYTIPALPPGPISNPGRDAIQAAVNPDHNVYLSFVAKNDPNDPGAHAFARTLEEQEANRVKYHNR
jgi:UPF0755 protein